jgi:hypothetical protein
MLDQDARTEVAPAPEVPDSPTRGRRSTLFVVLVVIAAVAIAAAGFAIGRASGNDNGGSAAVTTRPQPAGSSSPKGAASAKTADTVPTLAFGEAVENRPDKPLNNATRDALAADLVAARTAALKYPTVASARAAGFRQAGNFAPGAGAHFIDFGHTDNIRPDGSVDPSNPGSYIYDGIKPGSRLVGLMYLSLANGDAPAGFPGPNDHWHLHQNLCVKYGAAGISVPFAPDRDVTRAQCDTVHGQFMRRTVWMVHAWVVPGWESPNGVFSHANDNLRCADGTMHTNAVGFCKGT